MHPVTGDTTATKGIANQDFVEKNLDQNSPPHKFFEAFLPYSLTLTWNSYMTSRALQENASKMGGPGEIFPECQPFTALELRKHISTSES